MIYTKKRIIALAGAILLTLSLSVTAFGAQAPMWGADYGYGWCGALMWDDEGDFLEREDFEEILDQYVEDGVIDSEDKEAYLEQYDYCAEYGYGSMGTYGGGCCGRGMGRGRW